MHLTGTSGSISKDRHFNGTSVRIFRPGATVDWNLVLGGATGGKRDASWIAQATACPPFSRKRDCARFPHRRSRVRRDADQLTARPPARRPRATRPVHPRSHAATDAGARGGVGGKRRSAEAGGDLRRSRDVIRSPSQTKQQASPDEQATSRSSSQRWP